MLQFDQMMLARPDLDILALLPYIILGSLMLITLLFELRGDTKVDGKGGRPVSIVIASLGLLALIGLYLGRGTGDALSTFNGMLANDGLARASGLIIATCALLTILAGQDELDRFKSPFGGEFVALVLAASLGMLLMASAINLMVMFLGLELFSLALYLLCLFFPKRESSQESGLKYFLLSSAASAILLYGMALLYGATGTTWLDEMGNKLTSSSPFLVAGGVLILCGLLFKLAAVPFSSWAPDVYEGAPTTVTAFMSVATKVAAVAALLRVFVLSGHADLTFSTNYIIVAVAMMSMLLGHVVAIYQKSVKRMLAYSGIGNAGYVLIGPGVGLGMAPSVMFFLVAYTFGNIGAFLSLSMIERSLGREVTTSDLKGLYRSSPGLAGIFALCLASLAGLPPTGGFVGKYFLFGQAIAMGNVLLPAVAIVCSVIAAGYYFGLGVSLFDGEAESEVEKALASRVVTEGEPAGTPLTWVALGLCTAGVLMTGVLPGQLIGWLNGG